LKTETRKDGAQKKCLHEFPSKGLSQDCLGHVFRSTLLAKLLYASPAWSGFCSAADVNKLNKFVNKCKKLYNCKQIDSDITELFKLTDECLFSLFLLFNPIVYMA